MFDVVGDQLRSVGTHRDHRRQPLRLQAVHHVGRDAGAQGALHLLGRGVARGHHAGSFLRQRGGFGRRRQQLGDAEVQQLDLALRVHQDVARLKIPVNHQLLMSESDGHAHLMKQT